MLRASCGITPSSAWEGASEIPQGSPPLLILPLLQERRQGRGTPWERGAGPSSGPVSSECQAGAERHRGEWGGAKVKQGGGKLGKRGEGRQERLGRCLQTPRLQRRLGQPLPPSRVPQALSHSPGGTVLCPHRVPCPSCLSLLKALLRVGAGWTGRGRRGRSGVLSPATRSGCDPRALRSAAWDSLPIQGVHGRHTSHLGHSRAPSQVGRRSGLCW